MMMMLIMILMTCKAALIAMHIALDPQLYLLLVELKHLHNVETCFYCPQASLSLDFQCRDDVSDLQ